VETGGEGKKETLPCTGCGFSAEGVQKSEDVARSTSFLGRARTRGYQGDALVGDAASSSSHHVGRDACGDHHQLIDDFLLLFLFLSSSGSGFNSVMNAHHPTVWHT